MRVAIAQIEITRDRNKNLENCLDSIEKAIKSGSDLIVLPEVSNTGFYPENYRLIKDDIREEIKDILEISMDCDTTIIAGIAERDGKNLYSSALIIHRGKIIGKYRKTHLFPLTDERKYFSAGDRIEVFDTVVGTIGIMICYEIRFPEIARKLTRLGAEIIAIPSAFPKERIYHWNILLKARAIENQLFVVGANCVGMGGGNSMLVDPMGNVIVEGGEDQEVLIGDIDLNYLRKVREKYPFLKDLREDLI